MKKLSLCIFLGLLWCNIAFADILLKNCVTIDKDNSFEKKETRNQYLISFKDKKVIHTEIRSNAEIEAINKGLEEIGKKIGADAAVLSRVANQELQITSDDEKLVTAKKIFDESGVKWEKEIFIYLKDNTVEIYVRGLNAPGKAMYNVINEITKETFGRSYNIYKCFK